MPEYLVTVSGELPLRSSRTRPRFYKRLIENIRDMAERHGAKLIESQVVEAKIRLNTDKDVLDGLSRVFGVHKAGVVLTHEFIDLDDLAKWVFENTRSLIQGKKFAVRVKRSGQHTFTSLDVARKVGELLKPYSAGVDLENPEVTVELEVRGSVAYLYIRTIRGPGGLPVGVEGKALVLFSGGFDSPVAAWFTAKRGVKVDFLHYYMGSALSTYYAFQVAKELASKWLYGYQPVFILVDFTDIISEISRKVEWSYRQVVLRAVMYSVAEKIAEKSNYSAIVTGESIGQASSQTLKNLSAIEKAISPKTPVLRPLLGLDKEEIIDYSKRIGLYELSSRVFEACAIAPVHVVTAASSEEITKYLNTISIDTVEKSIKSMRVYNVLTTNPEDVILSSSLEIDFIPENAVVVDIRKDRKHVIPNSLPLSEVNFEKLRDKTIILVCETGSLSLLMAKELREQGYRAFSLKGGIRGCPQLRQLQS
jgi:thiamine biosynthesis protein ThiI